MGREIERKFLVTRAWTPRGRGVLIRQGFLSTRKGRVVRVRLAGGMATLTIKGLTSGVTRAEFEYAIPGKDARILLDTLCEKPLVVKRRHRERHAGHTWEIDVFAGENAGLVVAEIELESEKEAFARPSWLGAEVSHDPRYANASLVARPYRTWRKKAAISA